MSLLGRRAECEAIDGLLADVLAGRSRAAVQGGSSASFMPAKDPPPTILLTRGRTQGVPWCKTAVETRKSHRTQEAGTGPSEALKQRRS